MFSSRNTAKTHSTLNQQPKAMGWINYVGVWLAEPRMKWNMSVLDKSSMWANVMIKQKLKGALNSEICSHASQLEYVWPANWGTGFSRSMMAHEFNPHTSAAGTSFWHCTRTSPLRVIHCWWEILGGTILRHSCSKWFQAPVGLDCSSGKQI